MPTLLTTPKMSPALAARVEASVAGRRGGERSARGSAPRLKSIVRAFVALALAGIVVTVVVTIRQEKAAFARDRAAAVAAVQKETAGLTGADFGAAARMEAWAARLAGAYEGDVALPELRAPGALGAELARPAVYLRGPLDELGSVPGVRRAAAASLKDAFLVCLVDPPAARTEKALLPKVRVAYGTVAAVEQRTPNFRRLYDAQVGLPLLSPSFAARVEAAADPRELAGLKGELDRAPLARARHALHAEVLLVVLDEPAPPGGLTELDGERAHDVRVALVDLAGERVLLRARRRVDPSPWSQNARTDFASGLDACALALDVRAFADAGR